MKISTWAEVIGIVALILSLGFVGMEIRHNTATTSAQAMLDLNDSMNEIQLLQFDNPESAEVARVGMRELEALSETDQHRFRMFAYSIINHGENAFMFFENGLISASDFAAYANGTCSLLAEPGIHKIWQSHESAFQPGFNEYMKRNCMKLDSV